MISKNVPSSFSYHPGLAMVLNVIQKLVNLILCNCSGQLNHNGEVRYRQILTDKYIFFLMLQEEVRRKWQENGRHWAMTRDTVQDSIHEIIKT